MTPPPPIVPRLVVLTDRAQLPPGRDLVTTLRACAGAGLAQVVVREHDLEATDRAALVAAIAAIDGLVVVSSRRPEGAAAGLHLAAGQTRPADGWFGRSCHTLDEVRRAAAEGARYTTLSPFAASRSKPGYGPPVAPAEFAAEVGVPVLALGGIDLANAAAARSAGAHGVAVMAAVMRAEAPATVVTRLLEAVR